MNADGLLFSLMQNNKSPYAHMYEECSILAENSFSISPVLNSRHSVQWKFP